MVTQCGGNGGCKTFETIYADHRVKYTDHRVK